jgi:hypothetical protein
MTEGIQIGEVWSILGNETVGTLTLFFHTDGSVDGGVYGNKIEGFWDEDSQKLTFIRIPNNIQPNAHQIYTGYKFSWTDKAGNDVHCLAGSFEGFAGSNASVERNVFGWYAIQTGSTLLPSDPPEKRLWQDIENNFLSQGGFAYTVLANGYLDTLTLPAGTGGIVDAGQIYGDKITGYLNDAAGRTSFIRITSPNVAGSYQVYTGYRIKLSIHNDWDVRGWAGSFEAFKATGATAKRIIYGWYALTRDPIIR